MAAHPEYPASLVVRALLARALKTLNVVHAARQHPPPPPAFGGSSPPASSQALAVPAVDEALKASLQNVLGSNCSAATLAAALAAPAPAINDLLKAKKMDDVPFHLIPDAAVFRVLTAEVAEAKKANRVAYVYVDLTGRSILPLWLPEEAVGGRLTLPGLTDGAPGAESGTAQAMEALLTRALKALATHPRFFRSMSQWMACVQRFNIAAVACGMLSHAETAAHVATVLRLAESTPTANGGIHLATLYDELFRRHLSLRAQRSDPTLNILKESQEPSKEILALAQTRLESVLSAVGVEHSMGSARAQPHSGDPSLTSTLQQQEQASHALLNRANEATRAMLSQAEAMRQREAALSAGSSTGQQWSGRGVPPPPPAPGGGNKGQGKTSGSGTTRKAEKSKAFFKRRFGGGRGGKGGKS